MAHIVTLTTDFGEGSPYVGQMKGAILSVAPDVTLVDVTHSIPPQDVKQGALVLRDVAHRFPAGTVHVAVVDPGVGSGRALLAARIDRFWFIAPNNGLLTLVAARSAPAEVIRLSNPQYWSAEVSATFHGRDIMAPVAARLVRAQSLEGLGEPAAGLVRLDFPEPQRTSEAVLGTVLMVDSFGNAITNIPGDALPPFPPDDFRVACRGLRLDGLVQTYHARRPGDPVALLGSSGYLEIAVVHGSAAAQLGIRDGDPVELRWAGQQPK